MDQTNISSSMLSSLLHYNFSFISYISPERFCSSLIKQLQNNLDCHSVPTKKDDLNLIAFSALIELLELSKREFSSHFAGPEDNYNFCSSDIKSDRNIDTVKKVPEKEREIVHKWFSETLKIMQASKKCIAYIMVKTSQEKKCKFAKFLSRQFFLIGLKTGFFEVGPILQSIETNLLSSKTFCIWDIELLKDLVSHAVQEKRELGSTLYWFEQNRIFQKLSYGLKSNLSSFEVMEHVLLLQKLVKLGIACLNADGETLFLKTLFCKVLFPNVQFLLNFASEYEHDILCLQIFKVIDTLFVTDWLHPDQTPPQVVLEILDAFNSQASDLLDFIKSYNLHIDTSLIGKRKKEGKNVVSKEFNFNSNILRCIIVIFLKSSALSFQRGQGLWNVVLPFLQVFELTSHQPTDDSTLQKWFIRYFADQDNHWIASLFSLLLIYKHVKKSCADFSSHTVSIQGTSISCPKDFLLIFCPHKLFVCFAKFIDYDYLVLSDFLISPETSFLPYFLSYLHYLLGDWESFQNIMDSSKKKPDSIKDDLTSDYLSNGVKSTQEGLSGDSSVSHRVTYNNPVVKNSPCDQASVQVVSYSDSDSDTGAKDSPPPRKRRCSQTQTYLEQNQTCDDSSSSIDECQNLKFQDSFDSIMGMIIRLRMHMSRLEERGLFPYKANALIKLLEACEDKYEQ